ncbi:MAG: hypothetical protein JSV52_11650 [Candidatus Zixiibacteriota bacterium]|nr:MAG: hypothetical protein JSV52_11650 [candidate division Zixibacteria bacterium]
MDNQQKKTGSWGQLLPRLAGLALLLPLIIWLDVLAILWRDQGFLGDGLHEFHNNLPAVFQWLLWLGLPLIAAALGTVSMKLRVMPKLSRWITAVGVILAVLAILAATRVR